MKNSPGFDVSKSLVFGFLVVALAPLFLSYYGHAFSGERSPSELLMSFSYTGIQLTIALLSAFVAILGLMHFAATKDLDKFFFSMIVALAGLIETSQTVLLSRLLNGQVPFADVIGVSWVAFYGASAIFVCFTILAIMFVLSRKLSFSPGQLIFSVLLLLALALGFIYGAFWLTRAVLQPVEDVGTRLLGDFAYVEVTPLVFLLISGFLVFPLAYYYARDNLSYALTLSVFPAIVANAYLLFACRTPLDSFFPVVQLFKLLAYLCPFIGLCIDHALIERVLYRPESADDEHGIFRGQRKLRQQNHLIAKFARRELATLADLDAQLREMSEAVAELLDIDRLVVWSLHLDQDRLVCSAAYERKTKRFYQEEALAASTMPRYLAALQEERVMVVENLSTDVRTRELLPYLKGYGAVLECSIRAAGKLIGVVSFQSRKRSRGWTPADEYLATSVADLIALAVQTLQHRQAEQGLQHRLEFEKLLLRLSNRFINAAADEIDSAIEEALRAIGEFSGIDRSYTFLFDAEGKSFSNTHEWCAPGVISMKTSRQRHPVSDCPWAIARLKNREIAYMPDVASLPPEAAVDSRTFRERGVKALIWVPMICGREVGGFLGFSSLRMRKEWSHDDITLLQLVSEMFAHAVERKQAEMALRESETRFQVMADEAPIMIALAGRDGECTFLNRSWLTFSGGDGKGELGRGWLEAVHPEDYTRVKAAYDNAIRQQSAFSEDYRRRAVDGSYRWVHHQTAPRWNGDGSYAGQIGTALDITERRIAEEERRKLEAQVQHVQNLESLGVLAGGVAHDFNNLLMGILGNAGLALLETEPDSQVAYRLQQIKKTTERAAELTNQLLAYSGKGRFVVGPLSLSKIVEEMAKLLETVISKRAKLVFEFHSDLPLIEADATQLRQVIMNLITNASDALENRDGTISVRTGTVYADSKYLAATYLNDPLPEGWYVYLEVGDTGVGMNAKTLERIFDPFFSTKFRGRGLGLAAVLGIVRGHRGAISVASAVGKGTTFRILFPRYDVPAVAAVEKVEQGGQNICGHGVVLVVDDEETARDVAKEMLEQFGFTVVTAVDGRDALRKLAVHPELAAVLLDLTMPHMDGEETYREIARLRADLPVILISGYSELVVTSRFVGGNFAGFIQKPFGPVTLAEKVKEAIEKRDVRSKVQA